MFEHYEVFSLTLRRLSISILSGPRKPASLSGSEASPKPPPPEGQVENFSRNPEDERSERLDAVNAPERNDCLLESAELMTQRSEILFWFRLFRDASLRVKLGQ